MPLAIAQVSVTESRSMKLHSFFTCMILVLTSSAAAAKKIRTVSLPAGVDTAKLLAYSGDTSFILPEAHSGFRHSVLYGPDVIEWGSNFREYRDPSYANFIVVNGRHVQHYA